MTTNVKIFKSTDAGASSYTLTGTAPASAGAAGGMIGVLRACLINGYNSITATSVTVTSGVATYNYNAHGFLPGQCVLVAGSTVTGGGSLNGEVYVATAAANSFTVLAPGISDQTATGTITVKMAPAGWTEPYAAGTNVAAFRQGGGNQFYLNLDETAAQVTRATAFESMTAAGIANGTNAFPTTAQFAGGLYWNRSSVTDGTARNWCIIATDRVLYFWTNPIVADAATGLTGSLQGLADLKTYKSGDVFATLMFGNGTATVTTNGTGFTCAANAAVTGHYLCRSYTQIGTSVTSGKQYVDSNSANPTTIGTVAMTYPVAVDNGLWISPIRVHEASINSPRGELPGVWGPIHNKPLNQFDTFSGTGTLAGKTFMAINGYSVGQAFFEISNTWSI